jgi:hypothetical protein
LAADFALFLCNATAQELDLERETIELRQARDVTAAGLAAEIPTDSPCFTFYRYDHSHAGRDISPVGMRSVGDASGGRAVSFSLT